MTEDIALKNKDSAMCILPDDKAGADFDKRIAEFCSTHPDALLGKKRVMQSFSGAYRGTKV